MPEKQMEQWSINSLDTQDDYLEIWIEKFLIDRRIEGYTSGTQYFYKMKMALLIRFCESQSVTSIRQINTDFIRDLLLWLEETGHNEGGRHAVYRAVKTFIRWWANEIEPDDWRDPFKKIKAPKLANEPLEPIKIDSVKALIKTCKTNEVIGTRDKAMMMVLLDTGIRAKELLSIYLPEVDLAMGEILIRKGKGRKPRTVFISKTTRRVLKAYLKLRKDNNSALWVTNDEEQLTYWGLRSMFVRRSAKAGIKKSKIHDFRRAFALNMLRAGVDVYTLQKLMGHADLQVLRRYLAQTNEDIRAAHAKNSPVERWQL